MNAIRSRTALKGEGAAAVRRFAVPVAPGLHPPAVVVSEVWRVDEPRSSTSVPR